MIAIVQRHLSEWWQSEEKFGVLPSDAGAKMHLERIDP